MTILLHPLAKLKKGDVSVCPSVHTELGYHWTDFHKILYLRVFRNPVKKIQVSTQSDKNNGTLHEDLLTFMTVSC